MTLLRKIEVHLRASGMTPTRFGREAARDPRLVWDLRRGRAVGRRLSERIDAFIDSAAGSGR